MIKTIALCLGESKEEDEVDGFVEANHDLRCAPDLNESNRLFVSAMRPPAVMNNQFCHCIQPLGATRAHQTNHLNTSDRNLLTIFLTLSHALLKSIEISTSTQSKNNLYPSLVPYPKYFCSNVPLYG